MVIALVAIYLDGVFITAGGQHMFEGCDFRMSDKPAFVYDRYIII